MDNDEIKKAVKDKYSKLATARRCCCQSSGGDGQDISKQIGYSDDDLGNVPDANMGLGCGNPLSHCGIAAGDTVLDLGSGAGLDAFLASREVGDTGRVIGVDMTEDMVQRARDNAIEHGFSNVEFRLGDIEALPVDDGSVDLVISNCVINLAPDKERVFSEVFRVLRPGGRMVVSDMVLLGELTEEQRNDPELLTSCVSGALPRDEYLSLIEKLGFVVSVLKENRDISKEQYRGMPLESITVQATKPQ